MFVGFQNKVALSKSTNHEINHGFLDKMIDGGRDCLVKFFWSHVQKQNRHDVNSQMAEIDKVV